MIDISTKNLLDKALGESGYILGNGSDVSYHCPFCKHHKRKFEVNLDIDADEFGRHSCWVCKNINHSSGRNLITLFKKLNAETLIAELKAILSERKLSAYDNVVSGFSGVGKKQGIINQNQLPLEFKPLWIKSISPEYNNAFHYVTKKRKCTLYDIIKFNIGYCEDGNYNGKIIIPSYDEYGNLNFFTSRSYYEVLYGKHENPNWSKDIIGFELLINWNLPIHICEGGFDAIAIKNNAIPLFGKTIPEKLKKKIILSKVKQIYLALDNDAIKDMIPIAEEFISNGVGTYIVQMPDNNDPSSIGYKKYHEIANSTPPANTHDLMKLRICM